MAQIEEYYHFVPEGSLSTDFIVGFPGETDKDFKETLAFVEKGLFDSAFIFSYSPRPGTPALKLNDDVPEEEKQARLKALLEAQRAVALKKNQVLIGSTQEVLFESRTKRDENRFVGRTRTFKRVVVTSSEDLCGLARPVRIAAAADETLLGELIHL